MILELTSCHFVTLISQPHQAKTDNRSSHTINLDDLKIYFSIASKRQSSLTTLELLLPTHNPHHVQLQTTKKTLIQRPINKLSQSCYHQLPDRPRATSPPPNGIPIMGLHRQTGMHRRQRHGQILPNNPALRRTLHAAPRRNNRRRIRVANRARRAPQHPPTQAQTQSLAGSLTDGSLDRPARAQETRAPGAAEAYETQPLGYRGPGNV